MAADLFVVPTVIFRLLFVLVILAHDRRRIIPMAVTAHPAAAWTAQQLRNAFPEKRGATVSTPRSRFGLCGRRNHDRWDERSGSSNGASIALAERLRGARHRLDPTRAPPSRDRDKRSGTSPSAHPYVGYYLHSRTHLHSAKTRRVDASSLRLQLVALSPFQKSAASITVTTASRHNLGRRVAHTKHPGTALSSEARYAFH